MYFVDHNHRTTQFTDPRLNSQILGHILRRANNNATTSVTTTTTMTAPTPTTAVTPMSATVASTPVVNGGQPQVAQPAPAVPVVMPDDLPQSLLNEGEHLPKYRRDLVAKLKVLRAELTTLQPQSGHCRLEVSRQEVFEESYR